MQLLSRLLFAISLVEIAGTLPSPGTVSGLDDAGDTTTDSTYPPLGPGDKVLRYADLMSGPEPVNRFANLTVPSTANADSSTGDHTVDIRMSSDKQHVAELHGQRLFDIIHDSLLKICPYDRGSIGCYESMPGAGKPNNDLTLTYTYASKYWILDVPYLTDKGNYAYNAWITITARAIFRNKKYPGLGAATYEMAAGVYARATENWANCYDQQFNTESRLYRFCNVPKHVLVALPRNEDQVTESWLSMTVEFNGRTINGNFDCPSTKAGVVGFWETAVRPDIATSMGNLENQWDSCVSCFEEQENNCFDVGGWRQCATCA